MLRIPKQYLDLLDNIETHYTYIEMKIPDTWVRITIYPFAWKYSIMVSTGWCEAWFSYFDDAKKFINYMMTDERRYLFAHLIRGMNIKTLHKNSEFLISEDFDRKPHIILKSKYMSLVQHALNDKDYAIKCAKNVKPAVKKILKKYGTNKKIREYCRKILKMTDQHHVTSLILTSNIQ